MMEQPKIEFEEVVNDPNLLKHLITRANGLLKNREEARDAVFDVLVALHGKPSDGIKNLYAYLFVSVSNHCLQLLRQRYRTLEIGKQLRENEESDAEESIRLNSVSKVFPEVMRLLRAELGQEQFNVFELWVEKKSYKEIAHELGISVTAVGSAVNRAKIKARAMADRVNFLLDNAFLKL